VKTNLHDEGKHIYIDRQNLHLKHKHQRESTNCSNDLGSVKHFFKQIVSLF